MISYHPAKCGGYRHTGSRDNAFCLSRDLVKSPDKTVMGLYGWICQVTSQDHVIKFSCDFMRIMAILVAIWLAVVEIS